MKILEYPVFLINRDIDTERYLNIKKQLDKLGLSFYKFKNNQEENDKLIQRHTFQEGFIKLPESAIYCFLNHIRIWKYVVDNNLDSVLILEDDAIFDSDFETKFSKYWKYVPKDWDMVMLGCTTMCNRKKNIINYYAALFMNIKYINNPINQHVNKIQSFTGMHGYIINNKLCKALVNHCKIIYDGIEKQMCQFIQKNNQYNVFAFNDYLIVQHLSASLSCVNSFSAPILINKVLDKIDISDNSKYKVTLGYCLNDRWCGFCGTKIRWIMPILFTVGFTVGCIYINRIPLLVFIILILIDIIYAWYNNIKFKWADFLIILTNLVAGYELGRLSKMKLCNKYIK